MKKHFFIKDESEERFFIAYPTQEELKNFGIEWGDNIEVLYLCHFKNVDSDSERNYVYYHENGALHYLYDYNERATWHQEEHICSVEDYWQAVIGISEHASQDNFMQKAIQTYLAYQAMQEQIQEKTEPGKKYKI